MGRQIPEAEPMIQWGDDRQKETLAMLLGAIVIGVLLWWGIGFAWNAAHTPPPPLPHCAAEDMVLVQVKVRSFGWESGEYVCVHIDEIRRVQP